MTQRTTLSCHYFFSSDVDAIVKDLVSHEKSITPAVAKALKKGVQSILLIYRLVGPYK